MLAVLLFGGQLSAAKLWLGSIHPLNPEFVILLAVISALCAAGSLLFVSSRPHGRTTLPMRFLFMVVLDLALFVGSPAIVALLLLALGLAPVFIPFYMLLKTNVGRVGGRIAHTVTRDVGEAIEPAPDDQQISTETLESTPTAPVRREIRESV